jgi:2,4-dienoyl-CoA reductase-like NADH-dependent reductase (Old Yellow Enzyme family)
MKESAVGNTHPTNQPQKTRALTAMWQATNSQQYSKYQKPLTAKDQRELKEFCKQVGERAAEIMTFTIRNWARFTYKAQLENSLIETPQSPSLSFLLKHHAIAVRMYLQALSLPKPAICVEAPKPVPVQQEEKEKPYKMTSAEIQEAIRQFDEKYKNKHH